jgi:integrase
MPRMKLTAAAIERVKAPARGQVDYFDAAFPALALRVTARGVRSWVYFGRVHGKVKRATLGRYPALSLAKARQKAGETADAMRQGVDPAAAKRAARRAVRDSFEAIADEWLKRDQAHNRSYAEVKRIIERDVLPAWEGRLIFSIGRRDVLELIDAVVDRGAATMARRLHAHLHRLFRWCVGRGILEANPMADSPKPGADVKRDRTLNDAELALIWKATGELGWPFGPAFRLLVLTGARREEVGALRWSEIHDDTIELEGARTKNGEPHDIPLCASAIELLDGLPHIAGSKFVFTTTGETPVSGW